MKSKLDHFISAVNQRRCRKALVLEFEDKCIEEEEEQSVLTQFLQTHKDQLIDLQDHLERHCNLLPVFRFDGANYNGLIKNYLLPLLLNERDIEPILIKKANQFVSFKFGKVQLLDLINFVGGATRLYSILKD